MNIITLCNVSVMVTGLAGLFLTQAHAAADGGDTGSVEAVLEQQALVQGVAEVGQAPQISDLVGTDYHGSVSTYEKTILAIENQYGVYDDRLTKQLVGLGVTHQSQGDHKIAIDLLKRAIHISRINKGLYSLDHAPLLSRLIDSYVAVNDWKNANDKQYLLYQLKRRNYGDKNPQLLGSLAKMVEWHLDAYRRGSNMTHLLRAWELNRHAISIIESNFGPDDLRLSEALYRQALTSYHLAEVQMSAVSSSTSIGAGRQRTLDMTTPALPEQDQRFHSMLSPYRDGKTALLRRVELYKNNPKVSDSRRADALVNLGDWYFFFNKRESAMRTYSQALDLLATNEDTQRYIGQIFDQPHALTFQVNEETVAQGSGEEKQEGYVEAIFNITPAGRARDIKIVDSNPPKMMDSLVQRSIKATRYRPRIVDGKPVLTKGVTYRHVFQF